MSSSTVKKPSSTKVVDNLKTQLEELIEALDRLYLTINEQMDRLDFSEINELLADGFRTVLDGKPPNDVVEDAVSGDEDEESGEYDSECSDENAEDDEAKGEARKKSADEMMKLIKALTGASTH